MLIDKYSGDDVLCRSALPIAYVVLRILILLNWLGGAAILALLTATIVAEQWTFTALGDHAPSPEYRR